MELKRKDAQILYLMTEYCHDVLLALRMFSCDENIFFSNRVFRHACAMPIMQIGELARRLSDDFIASSSDIDWKAIKGMRNLFAHDYGTMNRSIIWKTTSKDNPILTDR